MRAPGRSMNLDGDGRRFRRNEGERVNIEIYHWHKECVEWLYVDIFTTS